MNIDNDYDNDGNNIVPCPICLSIHCPSKEDGKCPDEEEYARDMTIEYELNNIFTAYKLSPYERNNLCGEVRDCLTKLKILSPTMPDNTRERMSKAQKRVDNLKEQIDENIRLTSHVPYITTPPNKQPEAWDSEELEDIINDVKRGIKDSVHIHNFLRQTLTSQRASDVQKEVESILNITADAVEENTAFYEQKYGGNFEQCGRDIKFSIAQAIATLKDNK